MQFCIIYKSACGFVQKAESIVAYRYDLVSIILSFRRKASAAMSGLMTPQSNDRLGDKDGTTM